MIDKNEIESLLQQKKYDKLVIKLKSKKSVIEKEDLDFLEFILIFLRKDKNYRILLNIINIIEDRNKIEKWNNRDLKRILLIKINILLDNKAYFRLLYTFKKYNFYNFLFMEIVKKTEMIVSQKIKNLNKSIALWVFVLIILSIFKIRSYYYYMFSVAVLLFFITNIKIIRDKIYIPIISFFEINKIR